MGTSRQGYDLFHKLQPDVHRSRLSEQDLAAARATDTRSNEDVAAHLDAAHSDSMEWLRMPRHRRILRRNPGLPYQ